MKNISLIVFVSLVALSFSTQLVAQKKPKKVTTTEFFVFGNCGMCKVRIENAASIKGVKKVDWNKESKMLEVIFRPDKVTEEKIHEAVAEAGHQTKKVEANDAAYGKLPKCCAYKTESCDH